jgi:hypothetical protein
MQCDLTRVLEYGLNIWFKNLATARLLNPKYNFENMSRILLPKR